MSGHRNPPSEDQPAAVVIAVPDDDVDELVAAGLVVEIPTLRGPILDAVVTVGTSAATLVTLMQAPDTVRAFAAWLTGRAGQRGDGMTLTGRRGDRTVRMEIDGDVPAEAVLRAVFRDHGPTA